jgi:hypothetical protein
MHDESQRRLLGASHGPFTAALHPLLQPQPHAGSIGPTPFFDFGDIEAVSFVGASANTVSLEWVPSDAGISEADLKIVLMKNVFPSEDHAVVAARVDGEWLILDNRTLTLVRDTNLTRAIPEFVLDQVGVWRFVSKNRTRQTKVGFTS